MTGALDDITVLDLSRVLAGPYATMLLGDLGARIVKITPKGDDTYETIVEMRRPAGGAD